MSLLPSLDDFVGMDAATGAEISGDDHLRQSIGDILGTPIGSRVMRRDYGSNLFALIDSPMTPGLVADIVAATAEALATWEPRIVLQKVLVTLLQVGGFTIDVQVGLNGKTVLIQGVV